MADRHDRTEAPTPKRKRDARRRGQVARSQELVTWTQLLLAGMLARPVVGRVAVTLRDLVHEVGRIAAQPDENRLLGVLGDGMTASMLAIAPLLGALVAVGVVGNVVQTGPLLSGEGLKPKLDRLNPAKGLKRLLSRQAVWEGGKAMVRASVVGAVAVPPVVALGREVAALGSTAIGPVLTVVADRCLDIVRNAAAAGLLLAALDYAVARRRVSGQLRMTKQEIKEEVRQSEGDAMLKSHIRARQQAIGRNRMMAAIADATAVVVNPTHIAVALRYRPGDAAPVVVAKGRGVIAQRIREEAESHRVPLLRDVPLARALHAACEIGDEIPTELYEAVACILAVVLAAGRR